jgi:plasmid rolling circle replication initiator protein Rep
VKFNYLKTLSLQAVEQLQHISSEEAHARRQARCADYLRYAIERDTLLMYLNQANFCGLKTCPVCSWLRSTKWRIRIFRGLPRLLSEYPEYPFIFLTLTVRNCHFSELRSVIRHLEESWHRLAGRVNFPALGYLKSLEVTRPYDCFYAGQYLGRLGRKLIKLWQRELKNRGVWQSSLWTELFCEQVHPHIHCLMMVHPSYWDSSNYLYQSEWVSLWKSAAQLDYQPVVDIRRVEELEGAVLEVSKYCVKSSDMVDRLGCLINRSLYRLRLLSVGGVFNSYFSQASLDKIDITLSSGDEVYQNGVPCIYEWDIDRYILTRVGYIQ